MKKQIQVLMFLGIVNLYGFEVNTHQAITRCAIIANSSKCENEGTENLRIFATNTNLLNINYEKEIFEKYNKSYIDYAREGIGFTDWKIKVKSNYLGLIEAGVILEDSVYHNEDKLLQGGDGRFNNHFYAAQFNSKDRCQDVFDKYAGIGTLFSAGMLSDKALCVGAGARTDNIAWALDSSINLGKGRVNNYGIHDAFDYFQRSFSGLAKTDSDRKLSNEKIRKKYQAKLFVSLGFMVHMIQDLHSPAHVRDGSHSFGDYLEIYGRYDDGFNLVNGEMNHKNNHSIERAIREFDMKKIMLEDNKYASYQDFFKKEADWVSNNFFSEEHNVKETPNSQTGRGLSVNNFFDRDTIFDDYNIKPIEDVDTKDSQTIYNFDDNWRYIQTNGNTIEDTVKGEIGTTPIKRDIIGMVRKGLFFDSEHMVAPHLTKSNGIIKSDGVDDTPLVHTAINVMPRAVASTQAFINFFFRGQMETSLSDDHTKLVIKNVSEKVGRVHDERLLTFKSGGKFYVYYEENGINKPLHTYTLYGDIAKGKTHRIDIGTIIEDKNLADGTKITVVYDGNIGDNLGGYDDYGIGMKGLSADVFEVPKKPECKDKKLEAQIKQVQKWLKEDNRKHCVMFSPLNYSIKSKSVWTSVHESKCYSNIMYKNTAMGEYMNNFHRLDNTDLIDYFNKNVYHIDFEEEIQDTYTAGTGYSPRRLPSGDFDVSFTVTQNKNGEYYRTYNLPKLLTFTYLPSNAHIRAPHYHITCNSSKSLCNYLKRQGIGQNFNESQVDNLAPYDFLASPHLKIYAVGDVIKALNKYYGEYYGKSFKDDKYPKDWLKKMVDWIESYDCKKISKTNIFYDEKRIEKSNQLKGL